MSVLINDEQDIELWRRVEIERSNTRERVWPTKRPLRQVALMVEEAGAPVMLVVRVKVVADRLT